MINQHFFDIAIEFVDIEFELIPNDLRKNILDGYTIKSRAGGKWHPTQIQRIIQRSEAK
jgi:hypothetical protein